MFGRGVCVLSATTGSAQRWWLATQANEQAHVSIAHHTCTPFRQQLFHHATNAGCVHAVDGANFCRGPMFEGHQKRQVKMSWLKPLHAAASTRENVAITMPALLGAAPLAVGGSGPPQLILARGRRGLLHSRGLGPIRTKMPKCILWCMVCAVTTMRQCTHTVVGDARKWACAGASTAGGSSASMHGDLLPTLKRVQSHSYAALMSRRACSPRPMRDLMRRSTLTHCFCCVQTSAMVQYDDAESKLAI